MGIELVVFDCDGVLVDSEAIVIELEAELLNEAGFAVTVDDIASRFVGLSHGDMMTTLASEHGRPVPAELEQRIRDESIAAFPGRLEAVAGMPELLAGLELPRCVASSSDLDRVRLSLDIAGLAQFFDPEYIYSAHMVQRGKPAPDLFLHAAAQYPVDPANCLVIEDSPHGVSAAIAAGMAVVGFVGGKHARPTLVERLASAGADRVVEHPSELQDLI
ncbi:MAG: HAD family hydrolase [Acidimicrobiia bacterium]|nr:HAD family hydrolase [Acidimicrobiia bacterium]